jgi:hypothetical protein
LDRALSIVRLVRSVSRLPATILATFQLDFKPELFGRMKSSRRAVV